MFVFSFQQRKGCFKVTNHVKSLTPLKQVAPPPDVSRKVALAKTFLIPAYKSVAKYLWISSKHHHIMTNICFLILAQIRARFRFISHAGLYSIFNSLAQIWANRCHKIEIFVLFTTLFAFAFLLCIWFLYWLKLYFMLN